MTGFFHGLWFPLLCVLITASCSHPLAPEGHYQGTPVVADGNPGDWSLPLRFSNSGYTLQYNVTNDDKNMYIAVSSADGNTQLRILRSGMTIYFDPKGKKNKEVSLHFPIQKQPDPNANRNRGGESNTLYYQNGHTANTAGRNTRKEELLLQSDYFNTTGFSGIENGQFGLNDPKCPIRLAIKLNNDDSLLLYEIVIPLATAFGPDWAANLSKKSVTVGIVIDAIPGSGGGGAGPRPGGYGGMHGMGMHGGGMGGMGGGSRYGGGQPSQKEDDSWYTFRLATKLNH
jgi:hypothetical protein